MILAFHMNLANQLCAKNLNACIQIIMQLSPCNSLQVLIILGHGGRIDLPALSDAVICPFLLLLVRDIAAAATGGEHHHSHCACKQQSDDL